MHRFYYPANCLANLFPWLLQGQKYQIAYFFAIPTVETVMGALPLLLIYLFN